MKAERVAEKSEQAIIKRQVSALETKTDEAVANIAPAAGVSLSDGVEISMKGSTPKITKGDVSFQPIGRIHLDAGIFNDDAGRESNDDEALSVEGRLTAAPVKDDDRTVHLGASASYREPDQSNDTFDFDARADNRLQRSDSISAVITDAEHAQVYGIEAAASIGSVHAQGEYLITDVDNRAGNNPTFSGGYGQIAWFATGEHRPYSSKKGAFVSPKINRPLNPSEGDWGALELAARYSYLDLNDGGITGGELTTTTLGANWYVNNNVRFMGNIIIADTDENAVTPNDDPTVYIMRSQVKF